MRSRFCLGGALTLTLSQGERENIRKFAGNMMSWSKVIGLRILC